MPSGKEHAKDHSQGEADSIVTLICEEEDLSFYASDEKATRTSTQQLNTTENEFLFSSPTDSH